MDKVIRYRLYPTNEQLDRILSTIGCCRFVYNQALSWKKLAYAADKTVLTYHDCAYGLTRIKDLYPWLKEVDSAALQQSLKNLERAFQQFFTVKGTGYPKFKSKHHSRKSYRTVMTNHNIAILDKALKLPKIGRVKAVIHRQPEECWQLTSCSVSVEADGSVYGACHFQAPGADAPVSVNTANAIGLDYKSDGLYMDSNGHVCNNPRNYEQASSAKLAKAQRKLKHKTIGSANYNKQQHRIAVIQRKTANRRKDFLHKEALRIANSYDLVCVENLDLKEIARKGNYLGKRTNDNAYGQFLTMLEYKLSNRGKTLVKVDKWFPSSQLCHICGHKNPDTKNLRLRVWTCPNCGEVHDRDLNAAINILNEGIRTFLAS